MRKHEYAVSVMLALLLLGGLVVWTQATQPASNTALSCRPGHTSAAVVLRGVSLYPPCPGGKRG